MYSYVKDRGYSSNVLPSSLNQTKHVTAHVLSENKSTNQATFKWNNFKVAWVKPTHNLNILCFDDTNINRLTLKYLKYQTQIFN